MATRAKRLEFDLELDGSSRLTAAGQPLEVPSGWTAEHLLLAGLVRCSLTSLRYHARRAELCVEGASGRAHGLVTKRDTDERYAFVELDVELDVRLDRATDDEAVHELLAKAERDCFVGASLVSAPRYSWVVNGRAVEPR